jgi:hypothetical protein
MRLMVCSSLLGMYPAAGNCLGLDCFDWGVLAVFVLVARAVSVTCCPGRQTVLWRAWCANSANDVFVGAAVEGLRPHRRERVGAVLDLRPSFPGGARDLARGRQPALGRRLISAQPMRINASFNHACDCIINPQWPRAVSLMP